MVRAILARTKRKTRRVVIPQPALFSELGYIRTGAKDPVPVERLEVVGPFVHFYAPLEHEEGKAGTGGMFTVKSPHGTVGDIIKVRESYRFPKTVDDLKPRDVPTGALTFYEADRKNGVELPPWAGKLRPGIFLPEWASRIHLRVTSLGVEPVQHISRNDVLLEGVEACRHCKGYDGGNTGCFCVDLFGQLWDSVNKKRGWGWAVNPYVWDIGFEATKVR